MEAPDLDANVDMPRLMNDTFVMADQITTYVQQNPSMNDEPILLDGPNVGGHPKQAIDGDLVDAYSNMLGIGEGIEQKGIVVMFNDHDENGGPSEVEFEEASRIPLYENFKLLLMCNIIDFELLLNTWHIQCFHI
jgi:hypothetical protein